MHLTELAVRPPRHDGAHAAHDTLCRMRCPGCTGVHHLSIRPRRAVAPTPAPRCPCRRAVHRPGPRRGARPEVPQPASASAGTSPASSSTRSSNTAITRGSTWSRGRRPAPLGAANEASTRANCWPATSAPSSGVPVPAPARSRPRTVARRPGGPAGNDSPAPCSGPVPTSATGGCWWSTTSSPPAPP